jgi:hypothetical protein
MYSIPEWQHAPQEVPHDHHNPMSLCLLLMHMANDLLMAHCLQEPNNLTAYCLYCLARHRQDQDRSADGHELGFDTMDSKRCLRIESTARNYHKCTGTSSVHLFHTESKPPPANKSLPMPKMSCDLRSNLLPQEESTKFGI